MLGDFNAETAEKNVHGSINTNNLKQLINQKTRYKNSEDQPFVDVILTNSRRSSLKVLKVFENIARNECLI